MKMTHVEAMRAIQKCENRFHDAAEMDNLPSGERATTVAESAVRELSPEIRWDYPGLYPIYRVNGIDYPELSNAYQATLPEGEREAFAHWRTLVNLVRRGTSIRICHFGNRQHVKLIIANPVIHEIAWHVAKAMGYRYSEKTGALICGDPEQVCQSLQDKLFPRATTAAPAITWGWF